MTASVWHRPAVTEEIKDRLAERQARAAVALVRMGKAEEVWPLLRHSADPRLRSFIVNWLNPLGADPKAIAAELDRLDSPATRRPPPATQEMDAILFQPETSQRRALILALGTYGRQPALSPGEREPLTAKLLDLYRNDPDSGIHGAAEWTLRQWKQQEKLKELDAELMQAQGPGRAAVVRQRPGTDLRRDRGTGRVPHGLAADRDGTHSGNEPYRRMQIPRRFAIAAKEVTVEQFQRFLKERHHDDRYRTRRRASSTEFSPDPDGPWIASRLVHGRRTTATG